VVLSVLRRSGVRGLGAPIYYAGLRAFGVSSLRRRLRGGLILCYHNVVPPGERQYGDPGLHIPADRFERQMRWLAAHYRVVSLREFVERLTLGATLRSVAAVTFDDGYTGVFEQAVPILRALRIPATVFLVAGAAGRSLGFWWDQPEVVKSATTADRQRWLDDLCGDETLILARHPRDSHSQLPRWHRPLDWNTICAQLGDGIDLGAHSMTHRSLPALGDAELDEEIVESRASIHRATGICPDFFAYPYGLWNARVRDRVRAAGYLAGLTLDSGLNRVNADRWSLRRVNVPAGISHLAFEAWAAGLHA
jgi:peptidoglycan/xylan/chitin deacetylase (PgdA/CDA1 family)